MQPRRRSRSRAFGRISVAINKLLGRLFFSMEIRVFNEFLYLWGQRFSRLLKFWFSVGAVFGVVMTIADFMMLLLAPKLVGRLGSQKDAIEGMEKSRQLITFVVPGINVPWSDVPYIIFATMLTVGFHELGHAVAATSEGVHIEYIALFSACLVPGAFVAFSVDCLQRLSPVRALRIYCAGIWHNFLCCAGCYGLSMLLPLVLYPFYFVSKNPMVMDVPATSPLAGHVRPGDSILELARIKIQTSEDWSQHLHALYLKEMERAGAEDITNELGNDSVWVLPHNVATQGFCVPVKNHGDQSSNPGPACSENEVLFFELPCDTENSNKHQVKQARKMSQATVCLKATDVVQYLPCGRYKADMASNLCPCSGNKVCLLPVLHHGEVLIEIRIRGSSSDGCSFDSMQSKNDSVRSCQQSMAFLGDPRMLVHSLHLTNYWPRKIFFLGLFKVSLWQWIPEMLERFLTYIFCISAAMAVLNSAPVFYLDGEAIVQSLLSLTSPYIHPGYRRRILHIVLTIGSMLLILFLLCGLLKTIFGGDL